MNFFEQAWSDLLAAWQSPAPSAIVSPASVSARYEGASWSPSRSIIHEAFQSARWDIDQSTRQELQRKCRWFEKNNAIVQRLVSVFETYTAGAGLQVSPNSSDSAWNERAKVWWDDWCKFCDLNTRQNFGTVQSLWARRWFIDGEIFVYLTRGESGRPRIQNIEAHLVRTPESEKENEFVIDGVKVDSVGRPTGYFVGKDSERGKIDFGAPLDANFVHHILEPERTSQFRGVPHLASVINELLDLDDLHLLTSKKAKDGAKVTNVVYNEAGEIPPDMLNRQRMSGSVTLNTGATTTEQRNRFYKDELGGETVAMERGDKLEQFRAAHPEAVTMDYFRYKTELVCSGVDIPYCLLFADASLNGTQYRGLLDTAAAYFRARSMVIADATQRVYDYVMGWATRNVRELSDPPADWKRTTISTPRAPNVDVGRNSAAMLAELAAGATNFDLVYGPLGKDWRVEFRKLDEQLAFANTLPNLAKLLAAHFAPKVAPAVSDPSPDPTEDNPPPPKRKKEMVAA